MKESRDADTFLRVCWPIWISHVQLLDTPFCETLVETRSSKNYFVSDVKILTKVLLGIIRMVYRLLRENLRSCEGEGDNEDTIHPCLRNEH